MNTLDDLTQAIEDDPNAPVHYVLRGEIWLEQGDLEMARRDFVAAQILTDHLLHESGWGYVYQAYLDRADAGLRQCIEERYG
jgi:Tfp pilus assembly protein PilF